MSIKESNFEDKIFFITYDIGYGEKGIYETCLSYNDVIRYLKSRYNDRLGQWLLEKDDNFELSPYSVYIIGVNSEEEFDYEEWTGSDDW